MIKLEKYVLIITGAFLIIFSILFAYGYYELQKPYEITEIVIGTVKSVEGNKIHFGNGSYSGIVKDDGIRWDVLVGEKYLKIDNLNGYNISNLTGKFVEIRIHSVMNKNGDLISKIISLELSRRTYG